jgi:hypothetical protein
MASVTTLREVADYQKYADSPNLIGRLRIYTTYLRIDSSTGHPSILSLHTRERSERVSLARDERPAGREAGRSESRASIFSERFLRKWFAQSAVRESEALPQPIRIFDSEDGEAGAQANPQRKKAR